jgi:hypothetical protein
MRRAAGCLLLLAAFVSQPWAQGQGRVEASEASVKAAFLYKFASYVDWPPSALPPGESPFVVGVMGAEDVAAELERIVPGKAIHGHPATVRRVKEGESLAGVHLLFIGRGQSNLRTMLRAAQAPGLLLVTENERGLDWGGAINFVVSDERVGFEVALEPPERAGLKISSRMLNVARRVVPRP